MSEQKIVLILKDKTLTKLAGNPFGRELFQEQVKDKVDLNQRFLNVLPEQIDYLATSFVQGFFGEIYKQIGRDGMEKNFDISAPSIKNPKKSIMDKLMIM